jgi:hypothetical protein
MREEQIIFLQAPKETSQEDLDMLAEKIHRALKGTGYKFLITNGIEVLTREEALTILRSIKTAIESPNPQADKPINRLGYE